MFILYFRQFKAINLPLKSSRGVVTHLFLVGTTSQLFLKDMYGSPYLYVVPRLFLLEDVVLCEHTGTQTEVSNNVSQHVLRIPITDDLTVVLQENIVFYSDEKLLICVSYLFSTDFFHTISMFTNANFSIPL